MPSIFMWVLWIKLRSHRLAWEANALPTESFLTHTLIFIKMFYCYKMPYFKWISNLKKNQCWFLTRSKSTDRSHINTLGPSVAYKNVSVQYIWRDETFSLAGVRGLLMLVFLWGADWSHAVRGLNKVLTSLQDESRLEEACWSQCMWLFHHTDTWGRSCQPADLL